MKSIRKFKHNIGNKAYASPFVVSFNPKTYRIKELDLRRLIELENMKKKSTELNIWKFLRERILELDDGLPHQYYHINKSNIFHGLWITKNEYEANIVINHINVADIDYLKALLVKFYFGNKEVNYRKVNLVLMDCYMQIK